MAGMSAGPPEIRTGRGFLDSASCRGRLGLTSSRLSCKRSARFPEIREVGSLNRSPAQDLRLRRVAFPADLILLIGRDRRAGAIVIAGAAGGGERRGGCARVRRTGALASVVVLVT